MDLEAARADLARAVADGAHGAGRFTAARAVLLDRGAAAVGATRSEVHSLDAIVRLASGLPPGQSRRNFAVLLVHALGVDGLLPTRGETERAIRSFLELALLNPLRWAGYPFDGTAYDKRRFLVGLHATIDDHLLPPEPTMPGWLRGEGPRET